MSAFPKPYRIAVIGAASGIGQAAAVHLAGLGAEVIMIDRDGEGAAAAAKPLGAQSRTLEIADAASHRALWPGILAAGPIHGLVNCAGVTGRTGIKCHEVDPQDFIKVFEVNTLGALIASQAVLPAMIAQGFGRIVHVASIAGKEGNAGMAAYSSSKAGLIGLVKTMGKDYAETGVTINALAPAVIRTPMVAALPARQVTYMTDKIPMKRCGELDEAAAMIAWIVSPACSFTTGFTFDLSGGRATY